jgi:uncharacterized protein YwlG (UPF0340 family)
MRRQKKNLISEITICSVATREHFCVIGTRTSEIYGWNLQDSSSIKCLVQAHHDQSLYALAVHPRKNLFFTAGDEGILK